MLSRALPAGGRRRLPAPGRRVRDRRARHQAEPNHYRPAKEYAVAYGESRFCWESGSLFVTPVARIEGDSTEFAKKAEEMVFKGAKRFVIRRKP